MDSMSKEKKKSRSCWDIFSQFSTAPCRVGKIREIWGEIGNLKEYNTIWKIQNPYPSLYAPVPSSLSNLFSPSSFPSLIALEPHWPLAVLWTHKPAFCASEVNALPQLSPWLTPSLYAGLCFNVTLPEIALPSTHLSFPALFLYTELTTPWHDIILLIC